ncbi:hypothetical protein GMOD_00000073 [Pyrenophora seminiperda CCB06]|uniref:Uncharacterized protein n=1 Tax=Pyrenophora seminiperda CCB06 TaxID=1302712 RepID=A0A3M7M6D2_9PLEO|nr:hypothetical protein GMOD_00000073 [Pyrenophora seminiperda CCB06]
MKSRSDRLREVKERRAAEIAHKREELEAEIEAQQHRKELEDEENEIWRHEDEDGMRRMEVSVKPEDKLPKMPLRQAHLADRRVQDDRAYHGLDAAHTDPGRKDEKHPGHAHPVGFPGTGPHASPHGVSVGPGSIPMSPGGVSMSPGPHGYPTGPDSHDNHLGRDIKGGGSSNNQASYSKFNPRVGDENPDPLGGYTDLPKKGKHVGNDHQVVGDGHHGQSGHKAGKDTKNIENVQKNAEQEPKNKTKVGKSKVTVANNKGVHDAQRKANNHTNEKKPPAAVMKPGVDDRSENRIATKHDDKTAKPEALHKVKSTTTTGDVNTPGSSIDKKETRVSMSKNPTNVRHDQTRDENESSHSKSPPLKDHKVSFTTPTPKPHDDNQRKVEFANAQPTVISMKVSGSHRTTDVNATSHPKPPSPDQPRGPSAIDTSKPRAQSARNGDTITVNSSSSKMKSSQSRGTDAVDKANDPKSQARNDPHQPTTTSPKDQSMRKSPQKGAGTMSPSPKDTRTERSHSSSKNHKPNNTPSTPSDVKTQTMQPFLSEPGAKTSNSSHSNMKSKKLLSPFSTPKTEHMHSSSSKKNTSTIHPPTIHPPAIHPPTIHPPTVHPPFSGIKAVTMQSFEGKLQAGTLHTTVTQHTKIEHLQSIPHHMKSGTIQSPIKTPKANLSSPFSSGTIAEQLSYPSHHTGTEAIHSWMEKSGSNAMHSPSSNTEYQGSQYSSPHMKSASIGPSPSQKTASTPANTEKRPPLQIGYVPSPNKSVVGNIKSPHDSGKHSTGNSAALRDSSKIGTPKTDVQQGAHQSTHQAHQALQQAHQALQQALQQAPHQVSPQGPHQAPHQPWVEHMMSGANGPGPRKEAISPGSKHTIGSPEKKGFLGTGKRPIQTISKDDSLKGSRSDTGKDARQSTPTSSLQTPVILTQNPYKPKVPTVNQHANKDRMSHKHLPTIQTAGFGTKLPTPKVTVTHSSFHPNFTDADRHEVQMLESGGRKAAEDELFDHNPLKQQAIRGEKNKQTPVPQHANNKDKGKNIMVGTPTSKSGSLFQRSPDKKSAEPDKHKSNAAKIVEKGKNTPLEQQATGATSSKRSMIGGFFQAGADKKALKAEKLHPEPVKAESTVKPQSLEQHATGGEKSKSNVMKTPIANSVHSFQKSPDAKSAIAGTPRPKAMAVEEKGKHEAKDKKVVGFMGLGKKLATQPVAGEKKVDDRQKVSPHEVKVGATQKIATPKIATLKIATPRISTPKISTPKIATPKIATPKTATPKIAMPKIATPKIATPIQEAHKKQQETNPRHHQEATHKVQEKDRKKAVTFTPQSTHQVTPTVHPNPKAAEGAAEKKRKEAEHHAQEKLAKDAEARRKKHEQEVKEQKAKNEKAAVEKKKHEVAEHLKMVNHQQKDKQHADKEAEKKRQEELAKQHKQQVVEAAKKKHNEAERQKMLDHQHKEKEHVTKEAERKKHDEAERKKMLDQQHKAKEHADKEAEKKRKAKEQADKAAEKTAAEKKKREVAEHLKLADQQRKAKEHADKETEKKKQQALTAQHKQEAERQKKLDHDRKAKEDAEKKRQQDLSKQAAEQKKKLEHDRKAKEDAEKKRQQDLSKQAAEQKKKLDHDRKAKEEAEKKRQHDLAAQHKQEAERQKKLAHDLKAKEHAAQEAQKKNQQALAAQQKLAADHQKKLEHNRKEAEKKRKKEIEEREKAAKAQENARKLEECRRKKEQEQQQKKEKDRATAAAAAARQKVKPAARKPPVVRPSVGAKMPVLPKKK